MPLSSTRLSAIVRDSLPKLQALDPEAPCRWSSFYPAEALDDIRVGRFDGRGPIFLDDLGLMPSVEALLDATGNPSVHLWAAVLASRLFFAKRDRQIAEMLSLRLSEAENWRLGSLSLGINSLSGHFYFDPETTGGHLDLESVDSEIFSSWREQALELLSQLAAHPPESAARQNFLVYLKKLRPDLPHEKRQSRIDAICSLIASQALTNQLDDPFESGPAPLHLAVEHGLLEVVAALLTVGATPDVRTIDTDLTPLMIAARQARVDIMKQLVAAGADVNAQDKLHRTPLLWACSYRPLRLQRRDRPELEEPIRLLLEAGGDPFRRSATGYSVWHTARLDPALWSLIDGVAGKGPDLAPEGVVCELDAVLPKERRGIAAFIDRQCSGHPDWAVLAVAAPIADVSEAFEELCLPGRTQRDVAKKSVEPAPHTVWLLQLRAADWSLLIHSVHEFDDSLDCQAADLSERLDTRALSFSGEDTSEVGQISVFTRGNLVERLEIDLFKDDSDDLALDAWAVDNNLFVPPCLIDDDGRQLRLLLYGVDIESLIRVDMFAFGIYAAKTPV